MNLKMAQFNMDLNEYVGTWWV